MEGLRSLTAANSEASHSVNDKIFETAKALMRARKHIIFEDVIFVANQRQNRAFIQWDVQRKELERLLGRDMIALSRAWLRQKIDSNIEPLRVRKEVREHLRRKGRGISNETAGLAFPEWERSITERQIAARRHVSDGMSASADRVEASMNDPPPLLAKGD